MKKFFSMLLVLSAAVSVSCVQAKAQTTRIFVQQGAESFK